MKAICPAVKEVRDDEKKEVSYVTWEMSMRDQRKIGEQRGRQEAQREMALAMCKKSFSPDSVAEITKMPLQDVNELLRDAGK